MKNTPLIAALTLLAATGSPGVDVSLTGAGLHAPDDTVRWAVQLSNPSEQPVDVALTFTIQRNPQNWERPSSSGGDSGALPAVGEEVVAGARTVTLPAGGETTVPLVGTPLTTGAYLLAVGVTSGSGSRVVVDNRYVFPPALEKLPEDSPFGMNGSNFDYPPLNRELGVGWMRFENLKWNMSMPEPGRYAFDGSVAPWRVDHDKYLRMCKDLGMKVLPYTFQTPHWLSRAPAGTERNVHGYPPKEFADYGEVMFQIAARYGRVKHPDSVLKTADRVSGLGLLEVYQLWNEPNLEGPTWAPWVGSMPEFFEIFRIGAEAVKRADPSAKVAPAGIAGIGVDRINGFYQYQYADGKRPVDFADILCVHYYSGRQNPEVATLDRNATRTGEAEPGAPTYPESLRQLMDWRDDFAPGKPIWLTETGNDVGGPMGLGEWEQGAKIPRVTLLALAAGIDKVFLYRERGSTPAQHAGAGLMRNDDTYRASWFTFATLIRQFVGVDRSRVWRLEHPDANVWIYAWMRNGKPFVTAWTIGEQTALGLDLGVCEVVDAFGHTVRREVKALRLGAYPYYIGDMERTEALSALARAAEQREAERQALRKREAQRAAVLFDFGSDAYVGAMTVGRVRAFQPVLAADRYDAVRGWGFEGNGGTSDRSAHWIADPIRKDRVRMQPGTAFRFRVQPARYHVRLQAEALGESVDVSLRGKERLQTWTVGKGDEVFEAELALAGGDLWIEAQGWVELQGLSLVEI